MKNPKHYSLGLNGTLFKTSRFWLWILESILQALFVLFCCAYALGGVSGTSDGKILGMGVVSIMVFGVVVILVNIKIYLMSNLHTWFTLGIMVAGVVLYLLMCALFYEIIPVVGDLQNFDAYGGLSQVLSNPNTYLLVIILVYGCFYLNPLIEVGSMAVRYLRKKEFVQEEHELYKSDATDTPYYANEEDRVKARRSIQVLRRRKCLFRYWICLQWRSWTCTSDY